MYLYETLKRVEFLANTYKYYCLNLQSMNMDQKLYSIHVQGILHNISPHVRLASDDFGNWNFVSIISPLLLPLICRPPHLRHYLPGPGPASAE